MADNETQTCWRNLLEGEQGASTVEWVLLLAAVVLPSYYIMRLALDMVVGMYQMMTVVNALPFS